MEKFLKYFAAFIVIFSFCLIVYASQEEIDTAKKAMENYCQQDIKNIKGCVYDPKNPMYTKSGKVTNTQLGFLGTSSATFTSDGNIPLTRGYVTANAKGEMIFAGCYKAHHKGDNNVKEGDYFVFKIIALSGGKCKVIDNDIVFAKGTKYKRTYNPFPNPGVGIPVPPVSVWDGEFDGTSMGSEMATYKEWTATNGGECPIGFGLVANTRWFTSTKHRYVFSNDGTAFNIGVKSFIGKEDYVTTPGCTVQDKTGHALAEECFNTAAAKISETTCPSDYSKLSELSKTLEGYQNSCDNKFRTLYSKGLLESDAKEMKSKLITAVNNKLKSCQFNQCKISTSTQLIIDNNLLNSKYKLCKSGKCGASSSYKPSTSNDAKCYRIGNGTSAYFEWTDKPSGQPATLEKNMTKSECYGTYDTRNCRNCLRNVYKASGLNDTQIECMLKLEREKSSIGNQSENDIDKQFDDKNKEKLDENKEIRDQAYDSYGIPEVLPPELPTEDPSLNTCEAVLGPNLTALVKAGITIIQIVGAIIAVVKGMMTLIPPILAKDADALKKASRTLVTMAIILVIIFLFRPLLRFLGEIVGFDTSCI